MKHLSAFRFFALPLLLIVGFLGGFVPGTILAASIPAVQQHDTTQASMPAIVASCSETGLTGPALQENKLFCNSTVVTVGTACAADMVDGGIVYAAAIGAANRHILVGTEEQCSPTDNWSGIPINDVEFSRGFYHGEIGPDGIVRIYRGDTNAQVYP